jgi:hypothetical protein
MGVQFAKMRAAESVCAKTLFSRGAAGSLRASGAGVLWLARARPRLEMRQRHFQAGPGACDAFIEDFIAADWLEEGRAEGAQPCAAGELA